jgi:hypothetical protein
MLKVISLKEEHLEDVALFGTKGVKWARCGSVSSFFNIIFFHFQNFVFPGKRGEWTTSLGI